MATAKTVYVIKWLGSYGYVAETRGAKQGAFAHKRQLSPEIELGAMVKGAEFELDGTFGAGEKGPCIHGTLKPLGTAAVEEAQRNESARRTTFAEEFLSKFGHRPNSDLVRMFETGGWEAVEAHRAAEAKRHALAEPPPRVAYDKRRVPQL